ncbi:MAG TPA: VWA domain-containing protein [Caldilineae bacterium]|nr:VWA domain-containing protein [Caldilineae bacterium]
MSKQQSGNGTPLVRILAIIVAVLVVGCFICSTGVFVINLLLDNAPTESEPERISDPKSATLILAYSPEKADLITDLTERFNDTRQRTPDGERMQVQLVEMTPDRMVEAALDAEPDFQALSPDASLWLDQLDLRWADLHRADAGDIAPRRIADTVRYAVSPVVIAAWPEVAEELGWGSQPVGWSELQQRAAGDSDFRWSHASTSYASGMLATLAEFYAGAGKTRGLTEEDVLAQSTLDYVQKIESTVSFYGENEAVAMERMRQEGRDFLDALIVQEALVVQHNRNSKDPLVAIYPREGALWEDHPLALLDDPAITDNQRRTFRAFGEFLRTPEQQQRILDQGFRPADLAIPIDQADSPISLQNGVDPREPQTTLQTPGPGVIQVVQNAWLYTKRPSNIFLVVDTSGSMEGEKLENVRLALSNFVDQIRGARDRVGMVEFAGSVYNIEPLALVDDLQRQRLEQEINLLEAHGDTALLDAIHAAYVRLQREADPERINAIVVLTDGLENASNTSMNQLLAEIRRGNAGDAPVIIFAIGYGDDADFATLNAIAEVSGGQARKGSIETINELYRLLSQYF